MRPTLRWGRIKLIYKNTSQRSRLRPIFPNSTQFNRFSIVNKRLFRRLMNISCYNTSSLMFFVYSHSVPVYLNIERSVLPANIVTMTHAIFLPHEWLVNCLDVPAHLIAWIHLATLYTTHPDRSVYWKLATIYPMAQFIYPFSYIISLLCILLRKLMLFIYLFILYICTVDIFIILLNIYMIYVVWLTGHFQLEQFIYKCFRECSKNIAIFYFSL